MQSKQQPTSHCTNQQPPKHGGAVPEPVWVGSKGLLAFPKVQVTPGTPFTQTIFSPCCSLNDCKRAALSLFKISCPCSLFSCLSLARLLILLRLINGSLHLHPGPALPCSVCAGNVTWRHMSVQCCTYSKWVHLKCLFLSFSRFKTISSSHSWIFPPCCAPASSGDPTPTNSVTSSSGSSSLYTSTMLAHLIPSC